MRALKLVVVGDTAGFGRASSKTTFLYSATTGKQPSELDYVATVFDNTSIEYFTLTEKVELGLWV